MVVLLRTLGLLVAAGGLIWMVVTDLILKESRGAQVRLILLTGGFLLALSLLFSVTGRLTARVAGKRCSRCGKPVQHGHTYCSDHQKQAIDQMRDSQRDRGERS